MKKEKTKKEPFVVFENEEDFRSSLERMIDKGIDKAINQAPKCRPFIPIQEVENKVGSTKLSQWIEEGKIYPIVVPGMTTRIDRSQIIQVSKLQFA